MTDSHWFHCAALRRALVILAAVVAAAGIVRPAAAQFANTASIEGNITDPSNAPLPGVTVTLSSPALQVPSVATVSDLEGHYRFSQLPIGIYQVRYELSGFQPVVREGLEVGAGFAAKVDMAMKVGSVQESVTVSGASPIVDVQTTSTGTTLNTAQVNELLPSSRMYGDMSRMVAAMRTTSAPNIGRIGFGSTGTYTAYGDSATMLRIDGLEVLGNTYPDFAAAQEVEIRSAGTNPDVPQPGSVWNLVVKSGSNQFHGSLGENYITGHIQSNNVDDALRAQGLTNADRVIWFTDTTGDLGGRVIPDKLWFYGAYRRRQNKRTASGEVIHTDPLCGCVSDLSDGNIYVAPDHQQNFTGKVSLQLTPKYQIIADYAHDLSVNDGGVETAKGQRRFIPYESDTYEIYDPYHTNLQFRAAFSNNLLLNVIGGYSHYTFAAYDTPADQSNSSKVAWFDRTTGYFGGGSIGPASNYAEYADPHFIGWPVKTTLTFVPSRRFAGSHELAAGFGIRKNGAGGTVPNHAAGNYQITYQAVNGVAHQPVEIQMFNFPIFQPNRDDNVQWYLADKWEPSHRLTVNLGLRWDRDHAFVPPLTKVQGDFGTAGTYPRVDGNTWSTFSPRLAAAYDVTGDAKSVVKVSYARYGNGTPTAASFSKAGVVTYTYKFADPNHNGAYDPGEVNLDTACSGTGCDFLSIGGNGVATNIFNPDLERPYEHEVVGSIDRELAANMAVHAAYVYKKMVGTVQTINALRPSTLYTTPITRTDPGPDGKIGTSDDGGTLTLYDYDPKYKPASFTGNEMFNRPDDHSDSYKTIELTLVRRTTSKWGVQTTFSTTKNHVWAAAAALPQSPNDSLFPVEDTWNWVYKINGSYRLPKDILFSGVYDIQPGIRGQRTYIFTNTDGTGPKFPSVNSITVRLSGVGDYVGPTRASANLRASKLLKVRSRDLRLSLDLLNAFNSNALWAMTFASGPSFAYGTAFTNPRTLQFSGSFTF
jgi:hypothetical protein